MTTDTTEKGLETLIMRHMTGTDGLFSDGPLPVHDTPDGIAAHKAGGSGWHAGSPAAYDRAHCIDVTQLFAFLQATQPDTLAKLNIGNYGDAKNMTRQKFLARISSEIGKRGVVDVLRRGISDGPLHFEMFYGTPSPGNAKAAESFAQNRFRFIPRSRSLLSSICFSPKPAGRSWIRSSMSAWPPTSNNSTRTRRSTRCPSKAVDASPNPISTA